MVEEAEPTQRYVVTDAVYPIGDQGPPSQSANRYREHCNNELYGGVVALHHDRKAAKKHQIEEYNKRVGNGNQKGGCHYSGGFALTIVRAGRYIARCGKVEENAEKDQYDTPKELNSVAIGFDKIENEPHAQIGYGGIQKVAYRCSDAGKYTGAPAVLQRPSHTEHPHRPHGAGYEHPDQYAVKYGDG